MQKRPPRGPSAPARTGHQKSERLARALKANLARRKAQARARRAAVPPAPAKD